MPSPRQPARCRKTAPGCPSVTAAMRVCAPVTQDPSIHCLAGGQVEGVEAGFPILLAKVIGHLPKGDRVGDYAGVRHP